MRILIVEDEKSLANVIEKALKKEKYNVDISNDGETGLDNALSDIYDLIILDIMLPHISGIDILKEIRKNNIKAKVIVLTAKSELEDKLLGFNAGADDYITKPFHLEELLARVNAHLRNTTASASENILSFGDIELNIKASSLKSKETGEEINVGLKELQILEYFMQNSDIIISKDQLYDKIWGIDNEIESNNLEAYLSFLRRKFKLINSKVNIRVLRGIGYKLEVKNE